jgi:hypothetical protein
VGTLTYDERMSQSTLHGLMLGIALVLVVAAAALFVAAGATTGAGAWMTLCAIGAGLLAAAGAFAAGWFVVKALPSR